MRGSYAEPPVGTAGASVAGQRPAGGPTAGHFNQADGKMAVNTKCAQKYARELRACTAATTSSKGRERVLSITGASRQQRYLMTAEKLGSRGSTVSCDLRPLSGLN